MPSANDEQITKIVTVENSRIAERGQDAVIDAACRALR